MVSVQETERVFAVLADDATPARSDESDEVVEREEDSRQLDILGRHFHGAEFAL